MVSQIVHADSRDLLPDLPAKFGALVTDPPYGIDFMNRDWDSQVPDPDLWRLVLQSLKPGAYGAVFASPRTCHQMGSALESAGFEIRDQLIWLYGSGMPKSQNVSLALDKSAKVQGHRGKAIQVTREGDQETVRPESGIEYYTGQTAESRAWSGWHTALKPCYEPIILVRRPPLGTIANNVRARGVGGINVDACRLPREGGDRTEYGRETCLPDAGGVCYSTREQSTPYAPHQLGRWPGNVLIDEYVAEQLGQNARYFYCAKADRKEREKGLDQRQAETVSDGRAAVADSGYQRGATTRRNVHPTVKPLALMRWLVRLLCPPGEVILEPFAGSGTTLIASDLEGRSCLGIERDPKFAELAAERVKCFTQ